MGTWMQTAALNWLAFHLSDLSTWPSGIVAAQILPTFLLGALGGALADRWPKRTLIMGTQAAYLVLALLLAGLTAAGVIDPWQLLLISLANGIVQAIDLPARLAFVMDLVGREDLMNAVGLNSMLFNVARALGPALAALLLLVLQPWACFLANGLSYLAVLYALYRMDITGAAHTKGSRREGLSLLDGFTYIARHRELAFLFLLSGLTSLCGWPSQALLPALAREHLGSDARGYSILLSGTGLGALAAAWTVATFGSLERRGLLMGIGVIVVSAALVWASGPWRSAARCRSAT
jgi:MFS family permease